LKDGNGKVAISICGDPEDVKVFIDAFRKQMYDREHPLIGDICPTGLSFQQNPQWNTPYCQTGSIEFQKVVKYARTDRKG